MKEPSNEKKIIDGPFIGNTDEWTNQPQEGTESLFVWSRLALMKSLRKGLNCDYYHHQIEILLGGLEQTLEL